MRNFSLDLHNAVRYPEYKIGKLDSLWVFFIGYLLYSVAFTLTTTTMVGSFVMVCQMVEIAGLCLIGYSLSKLVYFNRIRTPYLKFLLLIHFLWVAFLLAYGLELNAQFFKDFMFTGEGGLLPLFVPIILFFPKTTHFYKTLFKVLSILGIIYVLISLLYIGPILRSYEEDVMEKYIFEYITKWLGAPLTFILLTFTYHEKRVKTFILSLVMIILLIAVFRARRGMIFLMAGPLLFAYYLFLSFARKKALTLFSTTLLVLLLAFNGVQIYNANKDGFFRALSERISDDTRSGVEIYFFDDFRSTEDWLIGRGFYGSYYCPGIDISDTTGERTVIETDYLNIILKHGGIYLGILLLIFLPAAFLGLWASRNILAKAAGAWILLWVVNLYPNQVFAFSMNYLLVWICVGICYTRRLRKMPEPFMQKLLKG